MISLETRGGTSVTDFEGDVLVKEVWVVNCWDSRLMDCLRSSVTATDTREPVVEFCSTGRCYMMGNAMQWWFWSNQYLSWARFVRAD